MSATLTGKPAEALRDLRGARHTPRRSIGLYGPENGVSGPILEEFEPSG